MSKFKLGTRGSPLALAQAHEVRARLLAAHRGYVEADISIEVIKTTGDNIQDRSLAEAGGKGLFTKELEEALLDRRIDFAVHSMKDVPTVLPDGLGIVTVLPREDVRDALISADCTGIDSLPNGARVGTSSLRRKAQLLNRRPDIEVVEFRGNVQTRLAKLEAGVAVATFLAMAGLRRLGLKDDARIHAIPTDDMLPAVAQGAIGIEARLEDAHVAALLAPINDAASAVRISAERALLATLDGSCRTPIAALAELNGDRLALRAEIVRPNGLERIATSREGMASDAEAMGRDAGDELKRRGGSGFFKL